MKSRHSATNVRVENPWSRNFYFKKKYLRPSLYFWRCLGSSAFLRVRHANTTLTHAHPLHDLRDTAIPSYHRHLVLQNSFTWERDFTCNVLVFDLNFAIWDADGTTPSGQFLLSKNYHIQTSNQQPFTRTHGNLILQDHFVYCCRGVSLIDSLKQNSQEAVSQASHKQLDAQCQNELQKDSPAHLCQVLPSFLTILSTQLFCIFQLDFRGKRNLTIEGIKIPAKKGVSLLRFLYTCRPRVLWC